MAVTACSCMCGSADALLRRSVSKYSRNVKPFVSIPKGKEKCLRMLDTLPQFPEVSQMRNYIKNASKWVIVIGYDENSMHWVDLANGKYVKNDIDLELLLKHYTLMV